MAKMDSSRLGATQTISFDGSVAVTNGFAARTRQIRLATDSACNYRIFNTGDATQTASTTDSFLSAQWVEYRTVTPGQKISAVKAATESGITATAGTLWVTEVVE